MDSRFTPVWRSGQWLRAAAAVWLTCTGLYFLTAPGRLDIIDGAVKFDVTLSLVELGEPLARHTIVYTAIGRDGRRYGLYPLATSVLAMPFVWTATELAPRSLEAQRFAFSLATVPFASGVVALYFLILGRVGVPFRPALGWALTLAFGTTLWPYAGSTFDTAILAFWLLVAAWATVEAIENHSHGWALAGGLSFVMLVNSQPAYCLLAVAAAYAGSGPLLAALRRWRLHPVLYVIGGAACGAGVVLLTNVMRFGSLVAAGQAKGVFPVVGNPAVGIVGLAVSPAKSVFLYMPVYLLCLLGLQRLLRQRRPFADAIASYLAIHIILISSLTFWGGDWAWGPRYLVVSLPLAAIGMPFVWPGRRLAIKAFLIACGVAIQFLAIAVDHTRFYFERRLEPFFWLDPLAMYRDSPLMARPRELMDVIDHLGRPLPARRVPGISPQPMTATPIFPDPFPKDASWVQDYALFVTPRPWPLWGGRLPASEQPGPILILVTIGVCVALVGVVALGLSVRGEALRAARAP